MLLEARKVGIPASDFWDMTDACLWIEFEAAGYRAEIELKRSIFLAYRIETFRREKRLKRLDSYMPKRKPTKAEIEKMRADHEELARAVQANPTGGGA